MASLAGSVVGSPRLSMRAARRWRFGSAADAGTKAMLEWYSHEIIVVTQSQPQAAAAVLSKFRLQVSKQNVGTLGWFDVLLRVRHC